MMVELPEMLRGVLVVTSLLQVSWAYFADWSQLAREKQPTCVDIPSNMTLCHNIGQPHITDHSSLGVA